ncbi:Uncharacterised protein [Pseudomonas aeruginosa]|nr:Uncharacterised protein [Pseudomonas aeruginosa]
MRQKATALAADGRIPLQNVHELLSGGYNTVVARCKNPFREGGEVCGKYMVCFRCPQMVVFEDDLWKMFSFYNKLLAERNKIAPHHWVQDIRLGHQDHRQRHSNAISG